MDVVLVITNVPDSGSAERIARELIESELAACVNVLAPCTSLYRWQGKVECVQEHPLFIKTSKHNYQAVEDAIRNSHPYELPEVIAVAIDTGLPEYMRWVTKQNGFPSKD